MNKRLLLTGVASLSLLTACQYEAFSDDKEFYSESGKAVHMSAKKEVYESKDLSGMDDDVGTKFGYVRHQKSPVAEDNNQLNEMPVFNRGQVADIITKMAVLLPDVNDVATLVTDEEVLIAYETDSENRFETADQVKKTAISVVPRYFHVYVSDQPKMIDEIEKYGNLDSNSRDIDRIMDVTIQEMLKAPQGRKLNDGENANGEAINEMNDGMGDEDYNNGTNVNNPHNGIRNNDTNRIRNYNTDDSNADQDNDTNYLHNQM
ncbi:YhcN/YlaJ family sporulation lipoprotein [Bacillus pinisoli]|uniref:YhcN/YlaJ family sporulation lipoprotein n=1 Tax=Bacillus pinisoli TaxID=2901866 RepID=UPI001FF5C3F9|nr:YhcN/YlaJ family sporulation lipoprotein [Bacillus pinisoli]